MKKISILIPCYNEEENVGPISEAVVETLERDLPEYDYELVFIDNDSTDQTRPILRKICSENPRIKAIFNAKNFGQFNSPYYGMLQCTGDCVISMVAALVAERLFPETKEYLLPSHKGKEPAVELLMKELQMEPVIDGKMALGEGTGAVMLFALLDMALQLYETGTTFSGMQISVYKRFT